MCCKSVHLDQERLGEMEYIGMKSISFRSYFIQFFYYMGFLI